MRSLFGLVVIVASLGSIALCAAYGWDQGTNLKDQITTAAIFGAMAFFSVAFHAGAIRIWREGYRMTALWVGAVSVLAFGLTAWGSLGGLAARGDRIIAERESAVDRKADNKRQIETLEAEKAQLRFKRTTQAAVDAAKRLADAATAAKNAECGNGLPAQRGNNCRAKETKEAQELAAFVEAQQNKAATDRADKIDAELHKLREHAPDTAVKAADPMKALLATLVGAWATLLVSWQKVAFAVAFDICNLAAMTCFEVLGHKKREQREKAQEPPAQTEIAAPTPIIAAEVVALPAPISEPPRAPRVVIPKPAAPKLIATNPEVPFGSVKKILSECLQPGGKVELADVAKRYREVCKAEGKRPVTLNEFTREVERFCTAVGIKRKASGDHVYLMDVQLSEAVEKSA